ncbi:hypothetical protein [Yinghuangia seranimata]|uniref:hypothetical protein n=1 Tax=Yinghuangia seranimata TaxID=408067 RepID=UPI00248BC657|nr:hypothetical protein [Yinghuangia seranimata]MDI2127167.1 hypothetical protein [Yinghuangia seranimata]
MSSLCDPQHAPVGDVGAALLMIDSRLKQIYDGSVEADPEQQALVDQFIASLDAAEAEAVLDGTCTLIFMFMKWLRAAYEDHDEDVIEVVVSNLVASMRMMPKSFRSETIPTMAGLLVAAANGLSPNLWREQFGDWTQDEMNPLEATTVLLAEHVNRITDDQTFAARMIADVLARQVCD